MCSDRAKEYLSPQAYSIIVPFHWALMVIRRIFLLWPVSEIKRRAAKEDANHDARNIWWQSA